MQKYPWLKNYPEGVPHEVDPDQFSSVMDLLEESVKKFGDKEAYVCMGKSITFNELDKLSRNFAAYLKHELKLQKGDRVAIQMPNMLQYPVALFGILRAGMIVVNTNPLYTASEMKHQFKDADIAAVVIVANFAHNLEKIQGEIPAKHIIITEIGDMLGGLKGGIVNFVVKHIKKMVPAYSLPQAIKFNAVLKAGANLKYDRPEVKSSDIAFLQYTGGTTGVSKGAALTQRNIVANMQQISAWFGKDLHEGKEIVITALPLYHIFALTVNCLAMLKLGAKNILVTNPRDMKAFIKDLNSYPFTILTGVNTLFNGLLNQPILLRSTLAISR